MDIDLERLRESINGELQRLDQEKTRLQKVLEAIEVVREVAGKFGAAPRQSEAPKTGQSSDSPQEEGTNIWVGGSHY